jgi:hypothetical protein
MKLPWQPVDPCEGAANLKRREVALVLTAAAAMPACGDGIDVAEWREEVLLHDGSKVTVWRRARRGSTGFPISARGALVDTEIKYEPMGAHWKGSLSSRPASFEIFDGVPHLMLTIEDRESCARKAPTDYRARFLRWQGGEWRDVSHTEFPIDRALLNLSVRYFGRSKEEDYKGLITWEGKDLLGRRNPIDTVKSYFDRNSDFHRCGIFNKM